MNWLRKILSRFKPLTYASFFPIFIGLIGINTYTNYTNEYNNGKNVLVKVIQKPINCESINSKTTFIKVQYNELIIPKKIGPGYCTELDKDYIKMKLAPNGEYLFFIDEIDFFPRQIGACYGIILIGIVIFFVSLKKNTAGNSGFVK